MPVEKSLAESLEELRQCVGTPWVHQGRKPHVGFDCAGFGKHWLDLRGYKVIDRNDYGRDPDGSLYDEMCRVLGQPVALGAGANSSARKGYMVMIQYSPSNPRHIGVVTEFQSTPYLIHADSHCRKVVEHPIDARWAKRIVGVWRVV